MSTKAYCAYCRHICLCVHASLLPESSHKWMFQVKVNIPRALLTSTLTLHVKPPPFFFTPAKASVRHYPPLHQMAKLNYRRDFPITLHLV